ncbi:TIGR03619 family F420-dependent LLM class oxidoreductase [Novosphingobium bradum]|uniref:TIGR03619 family F420-dependent LLM class oxidoreductase n=1 Tax=Novosphingobium bradum TaxID=1737444 RepID=A0ABV7IRJ0_9SPHN
MHVAVCSMNNLHNSRPDDLARAVEERGFESLWMGEHSHLPASGRVRHFSADGAIPETYRYMADLIVSATAAAMATRTLKVGFGVSLPLERDVFHMAKAVATLDRLSGGRLLVGIGLGWNWEEFGNVALMPWSKRYSGLRECVAALRTLWRDEVSSFQGEWYRFDAVWSYPKPLQQPWPPLHVGMTGPTGIAHAAEWGDAWLPLDSGDEDFGLKLARFHAALRERGRDPARVPVSVVSPWGARLDQFKRYRDLGITRAMLTGIPPGGLEPALRFLDQHADWAAQLA